MTEPSESPIELAKDLIRCPSVTPEDAGALDVLERALAKGGFHCRRLTFQRGRHAADRQSLRPHRLRVPAYLLRRACRRRAAWRREPVDLSALRWGGRGRRALRKGRCRHEGRYRLLRRSRPRFHQGQGRRHPGLDQPAHHRGRGRPRDQRHAQGARVDGGQWRAAGPCAGRRADQFHAASARPSRSDGAAASMGASRSRACKATSPIRISPRTR